MDVTNRQFIYTHLDLKRLKLSRVISIIAFRLSVIYLFNVCSKVVGREGVLASTATRDVHCGRRLVSGLFSRPRLPLGYSYVTTVPSGACRLNVSEIVASENYIGKNYY